MTQVTVGENDGIESALRRFKRQVSKAGSAQAEVDGQFTVQNCGSHSMEKSQQKEKTS